MNGEQALELVRTYAGMGPHRTGSPGGTAALTWLGGLMAERGARVELASFDYPHFEGTASVVLAGQPIEAMPLWFSATGTFEIVKPLTGEIDAHADEHVISDAIAALVEQARSSGHDGLILATRCPSEALCAINRSTSDRIDWPVALVAGGEANRLRSANPIARFTTQSRAATASNLIAHFPGPKGRRPVIVTTPLSGWFHCAGERGTGIAVAAHLAELLSREHRVLFLGATGHELGFLGGHQLAAMLTEEPASVIHIGSCIANLESDLVSICSASSGTHAAIAATLHELDVEVGSPDWPRDPACWIGESKCWAERGCPMLSIAGIAPHFHTPGDLPEAVTTPELLQRALTTIGAAARLIAREEGA
ncbi:MAG: hypothetical protein GC150_14920 [Rhizobiales bacterium]|nr:hypothetical protein [Hyphomicrobiales bacterium]